MSGAKVLWGQIITIGLILLLSVWIATEWTAWRLAFQPALGRPWLRWLGWAVYSPPSFFGWWLVFPLSFRGTLMTLFKRPDVRFGTTPVPETPYQRAGQVWDDRIGSARVQARNWRMMAFGALGLAAGLTGGLVWQSARGTVTPWVVQVDRLGQAQAVAPATAGYQPTDPEIAWHLARFIEDVRSVSADPIVVRKNWLDAYRYVTDKGALALDGYARTDDPFAKVGKMQVSVDVSSVIRASPSSFRVAWTERRYIDGALSATERWTAILTVVLQTPISAEQLQKNPLGIFVHAINWSKELG